jgi:hypothetical protein
MSSTPLKNLTKLETEANTHNMSYDEYARWLCLLEGISIVGKRVEQLKKRSIGSDVDWIKPLAFQKYIDERHPSMKSDLEEIERTPELTKIKLPCTTLRVPASV